MIEKIRDYKIINKLGEGGMGTVYLANDVMLERKVAIKVLNPLLTKDSQFTERFRHEAKVQASLVHPNIVALYNFFQEEDHYCMVMEYVEGETLKHLISSKGPIPEQKAIWILSQMVEAVGFAHKKGIIHRDIKPSNILISNDDTIKILDFGIAKILQDKGLTKTGTKMGTIYYMSPEQIKAAKDIDNRTDIYSIGVTFYEMLSGRVPFNVDTESDFEIMNEIVSGEIKDPREIYPHISDWIVKLLFDAVEKDRDKRIKSAEEFSQRLLSKGEGQQPAPVFDKTVIDSPGLQTNIPQTPVTPPPSTAPPVPVEKPAVVQPKQNLAPTPKAPVITPKKKSSAAKFAIFGGIGAVVLVVGYFVVFGSNSSNGSNQMTGEEPWVINKDYGSRYYGPSRQDLKSEDVISHNPRFLPASSQKAVAASL